MANENNPSAIESIKEASRGLRGTLVESLNDEITGGIREPDQAIIKFHGMYQQDDRDRREERAEKKLERLYSFMIRLRLPGGFLKPAQWLALEDVAGRNTTGVIKITTRQTLQLHGVLKSKLKPTHQVFNKIDLDTIAACGDINRNVVCSAHPKQSPVHEEVFAFADRISTMLKPKTRAYYEIWLDEEKIDERVEEEPLYGKTFLPRKLKIAIAVPPNNDVDVLTNDIGLIAIIRDGKLLGFNLAVGGGMGETHGNASTYARLGTVVGFVSGTENVLKAVYETVTIQRDYGDRSDRKLARLKYTIDRLGVDWFKKELEKRIGFKLEDPRPYHFSERRDYYGWEQNHQGLWYYTVFVENGRIVNDNNVLLKTALHEVASTGKANFRFTCNQNLILSDIHEDDMKQVDEILQRYNIIRHTAQSSQIRKNSMACVALNTCPLALAEAQRYLPGLISKIEPLLVRHGLHDQDIIIRMTGCPNGCARPYGAEIGFVGTSPGHYNLHIGGDREGTRLNRKYKENLDEDQILSELNKLFGQYSSGRYHGETFGDFVERNVLI